jgi:hypothetical protein
VVSHPHPVLLQQGIHEMADERRDVIGQRGHLAAPLGDLFPADPFTWQLPPDISCSSSKRLRVPLTTAASQRYSTAPWGPAMAGRLHEL